MGLFKKAVKEAAKLRMAISGPSGSGKTYSALSLASHLAQGKPIAVIDTEHGSASKYADIFTFDVAEMHPPFHPQKFMDAMSEAVNAGYGVVVIDSISHAWSGTGGVLDIVDEAAKRSRSNNTYTAWKEGTPVQNKLIDAIVQAGAHIIVTMRSKTEYILETNSNGKQTPKKIGMAPVQRDQFEYEFDIVLDMDIDNNAIVSKTRCPALSSRVFAKPGAEITSLIAAWLSSGAEPAEPVKPAPTATPTTNGHKPPTVEAPAVVANHRKPTTPSADVDEAWPPFHPEGDEPFTKVDGHVFKGKPDAILWGASRGVFANKHECAASFEKNATGGKTWPENCALWIAHVRKKLMEQPQEQPTEDGALWQPEPA